MRASFIDALIQAARADERVILLTGDHGYSLLDEFRRACPQQFLNAGVAEQNMVGVAAGLAKGGLRPVVYGLSAFVPIRVLEQIKLDVCYERLPVLFIGDGAGFVYSTLGVSHQCTEDVAALRSIPHLGILSPADEHEMTACMKLALRAKQPVYLRIGKADRDSVHSATPQVRWGGLLRLRQGDGRLGWIATGSLVSTALAVAGRWPGSSVWSAPCLKPLQERQVARICRHCRAIIVLEEHSVLGGLGSAIAEIAGTHAPTRILRIGVQDCFSRVCGSYEFLQRQHHLDEESITLRVLGFLDSLPVRIQRGIAPWAGSGAARDRHTASLEQHL
jgi:transketolase